MAYRTGVPHFGPTGKPETFAETSQPNGRNDALKVFERGNKRWQVVKLVDAGCTAGDLLYWKDPSIGTVTPTYANSIGGDQTPAGVAEVTTAVTTGIWIAVRQGGARLVKTKAANLAAAKIPVTPDSASNQVIDMVAASITPCIGVSLEAKDATSAGFTNILLNIQPQ